MEVSELANKNMQELNMLKSAKFTNETRKINKLYARVDEKNISKAGTPYPYKDPVGRNFVKNANFSNVAERELWQKLSTWNTGTVDRKYSKDDIYGDVLELKPVGATVENGWELGVHFLLEEKIPSGLYVTRSFMIKCIDPENNNPALPASSLTYSDLSGRSYFTLNTPITHEWTKVERTYRVTDDIEAMTLNVSYRAGAHSTPVLCDMAIANLKVEVGKVSTPFSLAISDGGPEETLYSKREGLIFEDVDFNSSDDGKKASALLISGVVYEDRLPIAVESETKKELKKIIFYNGQ